MSEKASQFRIGVFVLVGVAILLVALFLFGVRGAFESTHKFETYVTDDVTGLSTGSVVKLRGVAVGKVTDIGFSWNLYRGGTPRCVVVRFAIRQSVSPVGSEGELGAQLSEIVAKGLRAIVKAQGITGTSFVSLEYVDPAKYPPLKVTWYPEYYYIPNAPSQFGQILESVERTLANLEKLDVAGIGTSVSHTLASADEAMSKLGDLDVKGISDNVNQVAVDAGSAVREVQLLAQDARKSLEAMRLGEVGREAGRLLENLDARLSILIEKLSAIDVRALNETLAGTREAARNLNDALEQLKKYPPGFLFGGPPPPAPGLEKEKK